MRFLLKNLLYLINLIVDLLVITSLNDKPYVIVIDDLCLETHINRCLPLVSCDNPELHPCLLEL